MNLRSIFKATLLVAVFATMLATPAMAQTPNSISSLQMWLDPSNLGSLSLSGTDVTGFATSSTNNPTLAFSGGVAPTFNADAFGTGIAGVNYNGTSQYLGASDASVLSITDKYDAYFVVNSTGSFANALMSTAGGSYNIMTLNYPNSPGSLGIFNGAWTGTDSDVVPAGPQIVEFSYNAGAITYAVNGVTVGSGSSAGSTFAGSIWLATQDPAYNWFKGAMGDALVFNDVLDTTNDTAVGTYLMSKYNISGTWGVLPPAEGWNFDGNGDWTVASNWYPATGAPSGNTAAAKFGFNTVSGPVTVTVDAATTVNKIVFKGANKFTVAGTNALTLDGTTPQIQVQTGTHEISAPIVLMADTAMPVANGATLTLSGIVSGAGSVHVSSATGHQGAVELKGVNTYTGGTYIDGNNGYGSSVTIFADSSLGQAPTTPTDNIFFGGPYTYGNNQLIWGANFALDVNRNIVFNAQGGLNTNGNDITLANKLTGPATASVVKTGAGTLMLTNAANDFGGYVQSNGGYLGATSNEAWGAFSAGRTMLLYAGGNLTTGGSYALTAFDKIENYYGGKIDTKAYNLTFGGVMQDYIYETYGNSYGGLIQKLGTGTLELTGVSNNLGSFKVQEGTLKAASLGTNCDVTVDAGATLQPVGVVTIKGLSLDNSIINLNVGDVAADKIVVNNGNFTTTGVTALNLTTGGLTPDATPYPLIEFYGGVFTGSLANFSIPATLGGYNLALSLGANVINLVVSTGVVLPDGWNTDVSGDWSVAANWIPTTGAPNGSTAIATFGSNVTGPVAVNVDVAVSANKVIFDNANKYTIGGTNAVTMDGTSPLIQAISGSHEISAAVVLNGTTTMDAAASTVLTLSGGVSGIGGLTKAGSGTVTLTTVPQFDGNINVQLGALNMPSLKAGYAGSTQVVGGTRLYDTTVGAPKVPLAAAARLTLTGNLTGSDTITLTGNGDLRLTGDNSGYSGAVNVDSGVVYIGDTSGWGTGTLFLSRDLLQWGSVVIEGTGSAKTLSGNVSVASPAAFATLYASRDVTVNGNLSLTDPIVNTGFYDWFNVDAPGHTVKFTGTASVARTTSPATFAAFGPSDGTTLVLNNLTGAIQIRKVYTGSLRLTGDTSGYTGPFIHGYSGNGNSYWNGVADSGIGWQNTGTVDFATDNFGGAGVGYVLNPDGSLPAATLDGRAIWVYGPNTIRATDADGNLATHAVANRYLATFGPVTHFSGNLSFDFQPALLVTRDWSVSQPATYTHSWDVAASSSLTVPGIGQSWFAGGATVIGTPQNFVKDGAGTLTVTGPITYTGDTTVNAGTLTVTNLTLSPNVTVKGTATLNASSIQCTTLTITSSTTMAAAVPEPSTIAMLIAAGMGLLMYWRRK